MIHFYLDRYQIIISDRPIKDVNKRFGHNIEIIYSVKERESIELVKQKLLLSYRTVFVEFLVPVKQNKRKISEETRKLLSLRKLGKPRPDWVREKISRSKKGVSQFQGKTHTKETKQIMALKKLGNDHVKDTIWVHDPRSDKENRIKNLKDIPEGFSKGRDYYSFEPGLYFFLERAKNKKN